MDLGLALESDIESLKFKILDIDRNLLSNSEFWTNEIELLFINKQG